MSELVHVVEHGEGQPVTHAIVIGIGTYPWGRDISERARLPDLKSPPRSAAAIADWLITEHDNPERPLASVSLIVSDGESFTYRNPETLEDHVVPCGTGGDLRRCVAEWAARAGTDFENGAIFYFCGHGISSGYRDCLLSRSFGEDPYQHLAGVFERESVVNAMRRRGPRHQLFLFDACRTEIPELLDLGATASPFLSFGSGVTAPGPIERCILFSAAEGASAFGDTDGVSYFAAEFLNACKTAAEPRMGWWIRTHQVLRHMGRFLRDQTCQLDGQDIAFHRLGSPPNIPVVVSCQPSEHLSSARLEIRATDVISATFDGRAELVADCWRLSLLVGPYKISALGCELDGFVPFECVDVIVHPPFADIILDMAGRTVA